MITFNLRLILIGIVLVTGVMIAVPAAAQGGMVAYGTGVTGTLSDNAPAQVFRFEGTAGDRITVDVIAISGDLDPMVTLLAPDQQTVGTNDNAALLANIIANTTDAQLTATLPQDGVYSLLVASVNETRGSFVLRLAGGPPPATMPLPAGVLQQVALASQAAPPVYAFEAGNCPVTLVINARAGDGAPPVVRLRDEAGVIVTLVRGDQVTEGRVTVAPFSGRYTVESAGVGAVTLLVDCAWNVPGAVVERPTTPATETPAEEGEDEEPIVYPTDCSAFRLESPREGMPNGPVTVYWSAAPNAAAYQIGVYDEAGEQVLSVETNPEMTSTTIDVSTDVIGGGFYFTLEVAAVDGLGRVTCSDSALQGREAPAPITGG